MIYWNYKRDHFLRLLYIFLPNKSNYGTYLIYFGSACTAGSLGKTKGSYFVDGTTCQIRQIRFGLKLQGQCIKIEEVTGYQKSCRSWKKTEEREQRC